MSSVKNKTDLLSISAFAKRSRLSIKALRLYNAMDLLTPALVDDSSGYRFYAESQIERAKLIGLLRQLEMPLGRIAQVLELRGSLASQTIATYWAEVEGTIRQQRKLVFYLQDYLEERGENMFEILTREIPEQKVLSLQRNVFIGELENFLTVAKTELREARAKAGLNQVENHVVVFHGAVNQDSNGPVEVFVPFEGNWEPTGRIHLRLEPGHLEAYTPLTKAQMDFPGILEAYDAVATWISSNGNHVTDSPREVYVKDWQGLQNDEYACDVAFPFQGEYMKHALSEPKIETRVEQFYVAVLAKMPMQQMTQILLPLWNDVFAFLAAKDLQQAGAPFWRYRIINMEGDYQIEAGVPVSRAAIGEGKFLASSFLAGQYLTAIYTGNVKGKGLYFATGDFLGWAEKNNIKWDAWDAPEGHAWEARTEFYLTNPDQEPDDNKWQTELVFKIAD